MTVPSSVWQSAFTVKSRRLMSSSSVPGRTSGLRELGVVALGAGADALDDEPRSADLRRPEPLEGLGWCHPNAAATAASRGNASAPTVTRSMSLPAGAPSSRSRTNPPTR